ncbi:MAG: ATPase [Lachnospiraceae bacterium]|nr:ATPase [Lachnospiraceae bacterium]
MASRIEQIIEEIEEYVDSCKFQPLSTTKIVVNKEELEELLRELRLKTPEEIKRYQKIISNKDAILADAQSKADGIIAAAEARAKELVNQHEVTRQAYDQANETIARCNQQAQSIIDEANRQANAISSSAISYTDDMLANLENILGSTLQESGARYKAFVDSIQSTYSTVLSNRKELSPSGGSTAPEPVYTDLDIEEDEE